MNRRRTEPADLPEPDVNLDEFSPEVEPEHYDGDDSMWMLREWLPSLTTAERSKVAFVLACVADEVARIGREIGRG